jgi:hypothetical protein
MTSNSLSAASSGDDSDRAEPQIGTIRYPISPEDWFAVRHTDWQRIRNDVRRLTNPVPYLGQIGWACIGIGGGAFIALIPWFPVDSELPGAAHGHYAWITPALIVTGIASIIIACLSLIVTRIIAYHEKASVAAVLEDMDQCYDQMSRDNKGRLLTNSLQLLSDTWDSAFAREGAGRTTFATLVDAERVLAVAAGGEMSPQERSAVRYELTEFTVLMALAPRQAIIDAWGLLEYQLNVCSDLVAPDLPHGWPQVASNLETWDKWPTICPAVLELRRFRDYVIRSNQAPSTADAERFVSVAQELVTTLRTSFVRRPSDPENGE